MSNLSPMWNDIGTAVSNHSRRRILSVPGPGRTIASSVLTWAGPLVEALGELMSAALALGRQDDLQERYRQTFFPFMRCIAHRSPSGIMELKLALSAILSEWIVARVANPDEKGLSLVEAEEWFLGRAVSFVPGLLIADSQWIPERALRVLQTLSFRPDFVDLLPYVLETFDLVGLEGELPSKQTLRARKRLGGVVSTPSDVSDFVVGEAFRSLQEATDDKGIDIENLTWLDPACGAGLFLRSILDLYRDVIDQPYDTLEWLPKLYGIDTSWQAAQSCSFTLLCDCLDDVVSRGLSPWYVWQSIRGNLAVVDATLVTAETGNDKGIGALAENRMETRQRLLGGTDLSTFSESAAVTVVPVPTPLQHMFPEAADGFSIVVGNPPYSRIPQDAYWGLRAAHFRSAPSRPSARDATIYPLFVEMLCKLGRRTASSGGMVMPLSISYSSSQQFQQLRTATEEALGCWRFAFFDRTPDSLFGDDVKTRNAIALWVHANTGCTTHPGTWTTGLMRWNSRNRHALFDSINFVPLGDTRIRNVIPKLGSVLERDVYTQLHRLRGNLSSMIQSESPSRFVQKNHSGHIVYYSSTAYNWIPVFREPPPFFDAAGKAGLRPSLRCLACKNQKEAWFVFAYLASRLVYWLWRVEGDGFHVTSDFLKQLPIDFSAFREDDIVQLIGLATDLWTNMRRHPIESINAGKRTVCYYPYVSLSELDTIDGLLVRTLGLPIEFNTFLREFVADNIAAGRETQS